MTHLSQMQDAAQRLGLGKRYHDESSRRLRAIGKNANTHEHSHSYSFTSPSHSCSLFSPPTDLARTEVAAEQQRAQLVDADAIAAAADETRQLLCYSPPNDWL